MKEANNNIPQHWEMKKLEDVCIKIGDIDHKMPKQITSGYPYVSTKDFTDDLKISFDNVKYISKEDYLKLSKKIKPEKGDIIFPRYGTIGKNILVNFDKEFLVSYSCAVIKPNPKLVSSEYVYLYSLSPKITEEIRKYTVETTQANVGIASIKNFVFPLPPLPEQVAIVNKIEELFSELENGKEQLLTAQRQLKIYRQSLLKAAFEGKLTETWRKGKQLISAEELHEQINIEKQKVIALNNVKIKPMSPISEEELHELPRLPKEMLWMKLGDILWSLKDGPHYSPKYQKKGIPFISGGNIRPYGIDFKNVKYISEELHQELSKRCKPEKWDVLYTKGGTTGIAKVNNYDLDFNVWVHVAVLKVIPSINPFYLQYALNSPHCYKQSQKYTHGVGNQDLGLTRMIHITLPICSLAEQQQIVEILESKLTVCDKLEETISHSLEQTETLRQSILKKAFEGRLISHEK